MTEEETEPAEETPTPIYYVSLNARMFASFVDCLAILAVIIALSFIIAPIYGMIYSIFGVQPDIFSFRQKAHSVRSFAEIFDYMIQYGILKKYIVDAIATFFLYGIVIIPCWFKYQATPGKLLIRAKIVDARTLEKPSNIKLLVRYCAYIISALPLFLGFIYCGLDKRKQALHDKIAGTLVIHTRKPWSLSFLPKPDLSKATKLYKDMLTELKKK